MRNLILAVSISALALSQDLSSLSPTPYYVIPTSLLFTEVANTHNESQVVDQINSITTPNADEENVITQLALLGSNPSTIDEARTALSQMSGEQYTNTAILAEISARQFIRRLYDPLRVIIAATSGYPTCDCHGKGQMSYLMIDSCCIDRIDPWIEFGGGRTFVSKDRRAHGLKADTYEVTGGAQATLNRYFTFGVGGSYEYNRIYYNIGGTGKNQQALAGIYGLFRPREFYFLGEFVVDIGHNKVRRPVDLNFSNYQIHGSPNQIQKTLYCELGKDVFCHGILFQPFVGIEAGQFSGKKLREHGGSPLNLLVRQHSHTNVYSRLGFHVLSTNIYCMLNVDFGWQYRITPLRSSIKASFVDFGDVYTILGVAIPRNSFDGAVNISTVIYDRWELFAEFYGQGWSNSSTFSALGGVRCSW